MTWDEWKVIARKMNALADGPKPMFPAEDKDKVVEWFNCLKDKSAQAVTKAVESWFMKNRTRPFLADIRDFTERHEYLGIVDWNAEQERRRIADIRKRKEQEHGNV
jgi:hypothetical protein